jgi:RNA polymerase sigma factor (sigma-70 family)
LDLAELSRIENHVAGSLSSRQRWLLSTRPRPFESATSVLLTEDDPQNMVEIADSRSDQEDLVSQRQEQMALKKCIAALPEFERLLVRLRFEEDLSLAEIANLTGLGDAQKVHRQITAALKKIRAALQAQRKKPDSCP